MSNKYIDTICQTKKGSKFFSAQDFAQSQIESMYKSTGLNKVITKRNIIIGVVLLASLSTGLTLLNQRKEKNVE